MRLATRDEIISWNERARASVRVLPSSITPGEEASHEWFAQNRGKYRGLWVAVKDGHLLKVADAFAGVAYLCDIYSPGVFIARV